MARPRRDVMKHVIGHDNIGILFNRQIVGLEVSHFGVSRIPSCKGTFYLGNKGQDYLAPLYVCESETKPLFGESVRKTNISPTFMTALRCILGEGATRVTPEEVLAYAYAVFFSPMYRFRYMELLKLDFPRLPLTSSRDLFSALVRLGDALIALHLMEAQTLTRHMTRFVGGTNLAVEKVSWSNDTVWLDKGCTRGFRGVPKQCGPSNSEVTRSARSGSKTARAASFRWTTSNITTALLSPSPKPSA